MSRIEITDATGVIQVAGDASFPDGLNATGLATPDAATNPDSILIGGGDATAAGGQGASIEVIAGDALNAGGATAGSVQIQAGDADGAAGTGGNIEMLPGEGFNLGSVLLKNPDGDTIFAVSGAPGAGTVAFFGGAGATKQTVTGALSAVVDPATKAVLTSIIAAFVAYGQVTDGTT